MEKEFIPYEQALALKLLGFDEPCISEYHKGKLTFYNSDYYFLGTYKNSHPNNINDKKEVYSAPTFYWTPPYESWKSWTTLDSSSKVHTSISVPFAIESKHERSLGTFLGCNVSRKLYLVVALVGDLVSQVILLGLPLSHEGLELCVHEHLCST